MVNLQEAFNGNLIEKLYLLGWSRDSKIAFVVDRVGECDDCDTVVIQSLVTDAVLWAQIGEYLEYKHQKTTPGEPRSAPFTFTPAWRTV